MTNGDAIRAMNDGELAEWLVAHTYCDMCPAQIVINAATVKVK